MGRWSAIAILAALVGGVAIGVALHAQHEPRLDAGVEIVSAFGGLWLNALRMTVTPLVFALLVTGVGAVSDAASTGRLALRAVIMFSVLILIAALYGVGATMAAIKVWPVDAAQAQAMIAGGQGQAPHFDQPGFADWLRGLFPANPIQAAAEDQILQIVLFAIVVGFAATRLPEDLRSAFINLNRAFAELMIIIVRWVLLAAPLGVFALALSVGAEAGADAAGALAHYVIVVAGVTFGSCLLALALGIAFGGVPLARFADAAAPVWAVAFSTQSSLASLPAMVERTRDVMGVSPRVANIILPLAVAVFRFTSPVANLGVAIFLGALYGVEPSMTQIAAAIFVAFAVSVGSVGLPGQISFFASVAPICLTLGLPLDLLPILLAVEVIPDIFRTLGNVTADMSVTAILARGESDQPTG